MLLFIIHNPCKKRTWNNGRCQRKAKTWPRQQNGGQEDPPSETMKNQGEKRGTGRHDNQNKEAELYIILGVFSTSLFDQVWSKKWK